MIRRRACARHQEFFPVRGLGYRYLFPEIGLPLKIASPSLRVVALDHPTMSPVPVIDDRIEDVHIPPRILLFLVSPDVFYLLAESVSDARG